MKIYSVKGAYLDQTSFIAVNDKDAVVIDIGVDYAVIKKFIAERRLTLHGVFLTHAHFDHALGAAAAQRDGIKIYASEKSGEITSTRKDLGRFFGIKFEKFTEDVSLTDGDEIDLPSFKIKCFYTPGHTVDGMCFMIDNVLFGGDTFCSEDGYGRVDFPTGNLSELVCSLSRIFELPPETMVLHGHEDNAESGVNEYIPIRDLAYDRQSYAFDLLLKRYRGE